MSRGLDVCVCACVCVRVCACVYTFQHLLQAASHHVDVLDSDKLKADVGIVALVLITLPCSSVSQGVQLEGGREGGRGNF